MDQGQVQVGGAVVRLELDRPSQQRLGLVIALLLDLEAGEIVVGGRVRRVGP